MTNSAKQKKVMIATAIIFLVIITFSIAWIFGNRIITNHGSDSDKSSESIFTQDSTSDAHVRFSSALYHFSIITNQGYGYIMEPSQGTELSSIALTRKNGNTSEQPNRDTPNGFNTAVDDRIGIHVYNNDQNVSAQSQDIAIFTSWQKVSSPGSLVSEQPEIKNFGDNAAIEAVIQDGIGSFSRVIYFISEKNIVVISSSDVPKGELYDIANTFTWQNI